MRGELDRGYGSGIGGVRYGPAALACSAGISMGLGQLRCRQRKRGGRQRKNRCRRRAPAIPAAGIGRLGRAPRTPPPLELPRQPLSCCCSQLCVACHVPPSARPAIGPYKDLLRRAVSPRAGARRRRDLARHGIVETASSLRRPCPHAARARAAAPQDAGAVLGTFPASRPPSIHPSPGWTSGGAPWQGRVRTGARLSIRSRRQGALARLAGKGCPASQARGADRKDAGGGRARQGAQRAGCPGKVPLRRRYEAGARPAPRPGGRRGARVHFGHPAAAARTAPTVRAAAAPPLKFGAHRRPA